MNLTGFLQNRNNVVNGFLRRCLTSLSLCTDQIVVYDDASDEDVQSLYQEFGCTVVYGQQHAFHRELFHKQELLHVALRYRPDWIIWIDTDTVLGPFFEDRPAVEALLESAQDQQYVRLHLHNLNLWRSPWWYRTDLNFNELWHGVIWHNTGQLHYRPTAQLHQRQYPHAFTDPELDQKTYGVEVHIDEPSAKLLHFGFVTDDEIARKYFMYRESGQRGGRLERMVSEGEMVNPYTEQMESLSLESVPSEWFPSWLLPELGEPEAAPEPAFSPDDMARYPDFKTWKVQHVGCIAHSIP